MKSINAPDTAVTPVRPKSLNARLPPRWRQELSAKRTQQHIPRGRLQQEALHCGISLRPMSAVGQNPKSPHCNSNGRFHPKERTCRRPAPCRHYPRTQLEPRRLQHQSAATGSTPQIDWTCAVPSQLHVTSAPWHVNAVALQSYTIMHLECYRRRPPAATMAPGRPGKAVQ